jgi:predicted nucleic acid-binding protein
MSGKGFVDTNVLVYAQNRTAGVKYDVARNLLPELWESQRGVLSTQVIQEFCATLLRKIPRPLDYDAVVEVLDDYIRWETVVNTPQATLEALCLQQRHQLFFWDALSVRAAHVAEAEVLYSEDMSHGQRYGSVRVINPFLIAKVQ